MRQTRSSDFYCWDETILTNLIEQQYHLISVIIPPNKPKSLEFSIADGYDTPSNVKNTQKYDPDLQREMDAIIAVLNNLFDEKNTEFYIKDRTEKEKIIEEFENKIKNTESENFLGVDFTKTNSVLDVLYPDILPTSNIRESLWDQWNKIKNKNE